MRVDSSITAGLVFCTTGAPCFTEKPSWDAKLCFVILDILINTKIMSTWRSSSDGWELSFVWTNGLAKSKGIHFYGIWCVLTITPATNASFTCFPLFLGCFVNLPSSTSPSYSLSPWLSLQLYSDNLYKTDPHSPHINLWDSASRSCGDNIKEMELNTKMTQRRLYLIVLFISIFNSLRFSSFFFNSPPSIYTELQHIFQPAVLERCSVKGLCG